MTEGSHAGEAAGGGPRGSAKASRLDEVADGATNLAFPVEEYRDRLERTQAEMAEADLPVLVLHQPESVCWLSGFWHDGFLLYHALVVPAEGEPVLVLRALEEPVAEELSWLTRRVGYSETDKNVVENVQRVLRELGLDRGRVGIERNSWFLTVERYDTLCRLLLHADLVREPRIVDRLMLVKSPREVEYVRAAARIAEAGVKAGIEATRAGVSEYEVAAAVAAGQARAGHDGFMGGMGGTISSGYRINQLHAQQSAKRVQPGELVHLEIPGISGQYWAKLMRTAVVGEPTDEHRWAEEVILRAQDEGIARMAPGVVASEITEACRRPVLKAELRESYDNRVGYGLGLLFHPTNGELTYEFTSGAAWVLEAGMVFHMLLSAKGVAFSETVLVTDSGHEMLTNFERTLFVR